MVQERNKERERALCRVVIVFKVVSVVDELFIFKRMAAFRRELYRETLMTC